MSAPDVEVHIDFAHGKKRVGELRRTAKSKGESVSFSYDESWLKDPDKFSLEPALDVKRPMSFQSREGLGALGCIGDSAPDTWGKRLMQRAERRAADREGRAVRTLLDVDYLLGVSDVSRLGALQFKRPDDEVFQAPTQAGVPGLIKLGALLEITERVLRNEETDEDLQMIFAPGSSLGGARPKASVLANDGRLAIAKFPKQDDDYCIELWEQVALRLARNAGIDVPQHELVSVMGKRVMLSWRFDRQGDTRVPFLSALSMMAMRDGVTGSYPEMMEALRPHAANLGEDAVQLYRRIAFNVMISNVDDHLRNHGFLWQNNTGWRLSPAYDLNPVPTDVRARILSTNISPDEATCDIGLLRSASEYFDIALVDADKIIREVAESTRAWREVATAEGATRKEIERMQSAFEHKELTQALAL